MEIATALGTEIALSALSSVINKLGTYLGGDVTPGEMEHLKLFLRSEISMFIEEGKSNDFVQSKPLLEKLQEAALELDDLLDLYEYNQIEKQVSSSSTNFVKKLKPMLKEKFACILPISSLKVRLENLLDLVHQVEVKYPFIRSGKIKDEHTQPKYNMPDETTSTLSSPYFGRDVQYETIVKLLLDESHSDSDRRINELPVIAIKGIGGSGKTLTAQLVCKDKRIIDYFEKSIWVHVTADFDVTKLTKKIIESLKNGECPPSTNLDVLQTSLKESVRKQKRILLVLDDVWCEDKTQWDRLVGPFNEVAVKGSKVIMTTRLTQLARLHAGNENVIALDELEDNDCWSILKYYAFNNSKHVIEDPELVNVGNQIITLARSSPLALKVVGSSLRGTTSVNEWEKMVTRDILKQTMDLLSFSFQRLPSHLQRCFAYCSLFPKGYVHEEDLLVSLWIAQGYIENTNDKLTLEEEGSTCITDLLSYSFFEKHNSSDGFMIHDLLHELAERASGKLCHRIEHLDSLLSIPSTCIHLSMKTTEDFSSIEISDISKLSNLRSLIVLNDASHTNIFKDKTKIFQILSKLRALHVESDENMEVLNNLHIDQLKHLRYMCLEYNKKLPKSMTKLYHLQFFKLFVDEDVFHPDVYDYPYDHRHLKSNILPQGFGNLINLRILKFLYGYEEVDYLQCNSDVISIEKLKSLKSVPAFYPEKDNINGMVPLKNLPLEGSLRICDLENVKSKGVAEKAMLKGKKKLNELGLQWGNNIVGGSKDLEICEVVLEELEPHQNLQSLTIAGYQGVKIAKWMVRKSCPVRLHSLTLDDCNNIREINFLPPCLRNLHVLRCTKVTQIAPFGSTLNTLLLADCPMLRQLAPLGGTFEYVHLINCPMLMRLESTPNNPPFLRRLEIKKCPKLTTEAPSLLVEEIAEKDIGKCFSQVETFDTDEPLLVLVLFQRQALISSIERLYLRCTEAKPFPLSLEEHLHEFSSLQELYLVRFKTLPSNLERLSSLTRLIITNCPDVDLLPNLPKSLQTFDAVRCPQLYVNYNEQDGPFHTIISHIPSLDISS